MLLRAMRPVIMLLCLGCLFLTGCARHTYYVQLNSGKTIYADPPLVLDAPNGVYHMWIAGKRHTIPMDDVRSIDDAMEICYQNGMTDAYTCYGALYQY